MSGGVSLFFVLLCVCVLAAGSSHRPYCADTIAPIPAPPAAVATLKHVALFTRHGDRTKATSNVCWPNDDVVVNCSLAQWQQLSYADALPAQPPALSYRFQFEPNHESIRGSCGVGQLTTKGAMQEAENGRAAADAYLKQAGMDVKPEDVFVRSDNYQRTIMSAQALINALLNGTTTPYPLPLYTRDADTETITPNGAVCPAVTDVYYAFAKSPQYAKLLNDSKPLFKRLSDAIGQQYTDTSSVGFLFDCYFAHACHDLAVPAALANNQSLVDALVASVEAFANELQSFNNSAFSRAGAAPLFKALLSDMGDVVAGRPAPKVTLMSGHDTGPIQPILYSLGVADGKWPPYASRISIELWKMMADGTWAVRMEYNGKVLQPAGCPSALCPWGTFRSLLSAIVPICPDEPPPGVLPFVVDPLRRALRM